MSPDPLTFGDYQSVFAARIRAPKTAPRPPGASARRMKVYEELLFNNLESFLLACYPVTRKILGARAWKQTVRRFFSEHRSHSPLFRDIPKAFLDWMQSAGAAAFPAWPFLPEFMHYEWLELAVSISPEELDPAVIDADGDLMSGAPALHPTAQLACYRYPMHRIGPRFKPAEQEQNPNCYLLFRDESVRDSDVVRFILLNPLSARLLQVLREQRPCGHDALAQLARERGVHPDTAPYSAFVNAGRDLLLSLRTQGALVGVWRTAST